MTQNIASISARQLGKLREETWRVTGTGRLSTDEVRRILRSVGTELKLTDAEIDDIIHFADPEDFGSVDYALMVKRLINVGGV